MEEMQRGECEGAERWKEVKVKKGDGGGGGEGGGDEAMSDYTGYRKIVGPCMTP